MNKEQINDGDYIELFIRNLARDKGVLDTAKQFKLTGSDFLLPDLPGSSIYKEFVDAILAIDCSPVDAQLLAGHLNRKFEDRVLLHADYENTVALLGFVYDGAITPDHFKKTLKNFLKDKRVKRIITDLRGNSDRVIENLSALAIDMNVDDSLSQAVDIHPFAAPVYKRHQEMIGTGISAIDEHATGLCSGDFGIAIGYSGSGKTAFATNVIANNAGIGVPAMFVSCEEDEIQISQRFYSNYFEIPYTELHKGLANLILEAKFNDPEYTSKRMTLATNLALLGLKGLTPITTDQIYELMVRKFEKSGFIPRVVAIDQLQFIAPMMTRKSMQSWELQAIAAAELDELSHKPIGGRRFALWLMHQAKGKLKKRFNREEIDGFKGIIHKADLVLGLGRDGVHNDEMDVFSLKVRHCQDFGVTVPTDFQYMRFPPTAITGLVTEGYAVSDHNPSALPPLPEFIPNR